MLRDENKNVIVRWFDAVNQGDIAFLDGLADELFTLDFMEHDPRLPDFERGPAGVRKFIRRVLEENTNVRVTVHDIFECEDKVAYRFTVAMTETAGGKSVSAQLLAITHFTDGRIAEEWQLGVPGKW